jgi:NAD(P) transhydrogenase subunit beta
MNAFDTVIHFVYLGAAFCFVLGLHQMNSPATARNGNRLSAAGMTGAVIATAVVLVHGHGITRTGWIVVIAGAVVGSAAGLYAARTVQMTAMPQLVSLFNAVGGGAAAILAVSDLVTAADGANKPGLAAALDILIGAVTFSGSLIAAGKLQGVVPSEPILFPGSRLVNAVIALGFVGSGAWLVASPGNLVPLVILAVASLAFGVTMVLPIGGADMPVVISLLNAFTGTAVAMAGFVVNNVVLIIAGALVGASGTILTLLMANAMNRSVPNIIIGGFGVGDQGTAHTSASGGTVRETSADDVAIQLAYASKVIIVPGYGLAAAQAQHELAALGELLEKRGVDVCYAIHPVAGRMPGHMNVLLAEANIPYPQMREMDDVNREFSLADVALVIGANDVTNPAARRPGNPISGMPILDVDQAKNVIVIKRSMGHGYAGLDNELYTSPNTAMYFADAKKGLAVLVSSVKTLVGA